MRLATPYLLFLGDAHDALAAKVAQGIKDWRPENVVGQLRHPGCQADLGVSDLTIAQAAARGARTMVVGVANRGGVIAEAWVDALVEALEAGMDLAAGLHAKLADLPRVRETVARLGRRLEDAVHDVRHPTERFPIGDGKKRPGKRLLAVGTDCSCGKMYTALALDAEMRRRGRPSAFRATGQTGILIAGAGVSIDAVVSDFVSGAVETLAPAVDPAQWDFVEGQGSLQHPSYAGVTMGLIHGAQPDALVICHEPTRTHMRGLPHYPIPSLEQAMASALEAARLTNPAARYVGAAINTAALDEGRAMDTLAQIEARLGLPTVDPIRTGVGRIVDALW